MEGNCRVLFLPDNRYIVVSRGDNLLRAAMDADVHINASCGGSGSCGKCRVVIEEGEVDREPNPKLTGADIAKGYAMACQTRVLSDLHVTVPLESRIGDKRIFERAEPTPAHGYLRQHAAGGERHRPYRVAGQPRPLPGRWGKRRGQQPGRRRHDLSGVIRPVAASGRRPE